MCPAEWGLFLMSKFSKAEKLQMVSEYQQEHCSLTWIAKSHKISESYLREILKRYQAEGEAGIGTGQQGKAKGRYTGSFKLSAVKERVDSGISYRELARKYGLNHVVIQKWERIYLSQGEEGLLCEQRGRTTKETSPKVGRPKKKPLTPVDEDLIAEVQRLRMENEYLKKLQA